GQGGCGRRRCVRVKSSVSAPFSPPQLPGEVILLQTFLGTIDIEVAKPMYEVLGACGADQRPQGFESRADQWTQCAGLSAHFLRRPGTHEPNQPWSNPRELAPAQAQWTDWVEQPARHASDRPRHRHRRHRGSVKAAGIAE